MNKLVTHYRNSTQLKKEDLTKAEKDEIISTLNLLKKCESLGPEQREEEFMTMCFNYGLDDDQARAAKEIFLGIEPSEVWEKNILALERGEWVDSMETKCFKRWNKQRPSILTTLEQIFQCKIPDVDSELAHRLKDSLEEISNPELISDGAVGQFAKWINEVDEAEAQNSRDIGKRGRAASTPTLIKRASPPCFASPPLLHFPLNESQDNTIEDKKKKGKKKEEKSKPSAEFDSSGASPPSSPRKSQDDETERKAEMKRKKSKRQERENISKSQEDQVEVAKRKASWMRKLSVDRELGKKKEHPEKTNYNRRSSMDSLTGKTISVSLEAWVREEDKKGRSESDTEYRRRRSSKELGKREEKEGKREKDDKKGHENNKMDKKESKKDKKAAPLLCWMGSAEDLRTLAENASPSDQNRVALTRSKESPTEEKRKEKEKELESFSKLKIENHAKAKTIAVYQSFKT